MSIKVKICGIKKLAIANAAIEAGADYIGFVYFAKSPRHLSFTKMGAFKNLVYGNTKKVALLVNPKDSKIEQVISVLNPDYLQLHGNESVKRVREIKDKFKIKIIKAIAIGSQVDVEMVHEYDEIADIILCDAKSPDNLKDALPGGNAISFDWKLISGMKIKSQIMLAGGINSANVDQALSLTGVRQFDISSSVEISPGVKDAGLIKEFIRTAKSI